MVYEWDTKVFNNFILIGFYNSYTSPKESKNVILKLLMLKMHNYLLMLPYKQFHSESFTANEEGFIQLNKTPQSGEVKHMGYERIY